MEILMCDDDTIQVTIEPPTVCPTLAAPVPLAASGFSTVGERAVCVEGDEIPPTLRAPMGYTAPPYTIAGEAILSVTLTPSNTTETARDRGKAMLCKGQTFAATMSVTVPAQMPTPAGPQPDPVVKKTGTARFITTNTSVQGE